MTPSDGMLAATARRAKLAEKARSQPRGERGQFVATPKPVCTVSLEDIPLMCRDTAPTRPLSSCPWPLAVTIAILAVIIGWAACAWFGGVR